MGFSLSQSLSLYLKNESEMKWDSLSFSLSLFKTLFDSLFLFELWLADCYCLALFYSFINICPCFWFYPLVLVRYNWLSFSVLWFVIVNLSDWLLWLGAMGLSVEWGVDEGMGPRWDIWIERSKCTWGVC